MAERAVGHGSFGVVFQVCVIDRLDYDDDGLVFQWNIILWCWCFYHKHLSGIVWLDDVDVDVDVATMMMVFH